MSVPTASSVEANNTLLRYGSYNLKFTIGLILKFFTNIRILNKNMLQDKKIKQIKNTLFVK